MPANEPKKSASQLLADEAAEVHMDVDLTGAPKLRPPIKMRPGRQAKLIRVYEKLVTVVKQSTPSSDILDLLDEALTALEPFALNAEEFDDWASDPANVSKIVPLYLRHVEQMGETTRSAN